MKNPILLESELQKSSGDGTVSLHAHSPRSRRAGYSKSNFMAVSKSGSMQCLQIKSPSFVCQGCSSPGTGSSLLLSVMQVMHYQIL